MMSGLGRKQGEWKRTLKNTRGGASDFPSHFVGGFHASTSSPCRVGGVTLTHSQPECCATKKTPPPCVVDAAAANELADIVITVRRRHNPSALAMEDPFAGKECSDEQYEIMKGFIMEMGGKEATNDLTEEERKSNSEILTARGGMHITPAEMDAIFDAEDKDKDGLLDKQEFFASQTASFTHQESIGLKVTFPTEEESAHYYDDFFNKITPEVEGVSKLDWYIFRLAVNRFQEEMRVHFQHTR
jgi:hypothetical protein